MANETNENGAISENGEKQNDRKLNEQKVTKKTLERLEKIHKDIEILNSNKIATENRPKNDFLSNKIALRNKALNFYISCLSFISTLQLTKKELRAHPVIFESIRLRVLLEKLIPLINSQSKTKNILKSQFVDANDSFNPNPFDFNIDESVEQKQSLQSDKISSAKPISKKKTNSGASGNSEDTVYKVKKTESVPYPVENKISRKEKSKKERERKRLLQSGAMETLRNDLRNASGLPEERKTRLSNLNSNNMNEIKRIMAKEEYELENFVRLPIKKKEKRRRSELERIVSNNIEADFSREVAELGRIRDFNEKDSIDLPKRNSKRRKSIKKWKK